MRLTKARIMNFKSVLDSEWFTVDQLTCLVGKNESGKTAVLEALEKLNSVRPGRESLRDTDYPRMNWSEYDESKTVDTAIYTVWQLDEEERTCLESMVGDSTLLTSDSIEVRKNYDNKLTWNFPFEVPAVVAHALSTSGLTDTEKSDLKKVGTTQELLKQLSDLTEPSQRQVALLSDLQARWPNGGVQATCTAYFASRLPRLVYYSQFDRLPGRVALEQLLQARRNGALEDLPGSRVFIALLSMVGTTPESINEISTSEQLISKLEAVQNRLSKKIFKYWSQNKHLKVRFRFDEASPGDSAPFNSGKVFQTRIENMRHEATIRLDERSTGFIWFFSFLVWFSEVQREFGERLVVLLDEPGLTLHARAQSDLLRYFNEELLPKYQVLYTTHSPFMIDSRNLLSCRTVEDATGEDEEVLGTKIGDRALSTDSDTLFPLQAALGYDLTQTLFVGADSLLVEGPSDLLYLQWASDRLRALKRTALDARWTITPCGGISKVPSFLALFGGNRLHVAVLTDYGQGDKKKVRELRDSELLRGGRVFSAEQYAAEEGATEADVEDILGRRFYVDLVNATYRLPPKNKMPATKPADSSPRVVVETEAASRLWAANTEEYNHFAPSRYLIEHGADFEGTWVDESLDRFERLFQDLNGLL